MIVSFTFDDALSSQSPALSVFDAHDMRATFYVNTGTVGTSGHLSWAQLRQFSSAGHEVGGHTVNHAPLTDVDEATARAEIQGDITTLQAQGFPRPVSFAYPYGYHGPDEQRYVREAGYASARTTDIYQRESNPPANAYALRIPRGSLDGSEGLEALKKDVTLTPRQPRKEPPRLPDAQLLLPDPRGDRRVPCLAATACRQRNRRQDRRRGTTGDSPQWEPAAGRGSRTGQTVPGGSTVQLDGSGSSDVNGDPLTYQWTQTAGTPVTLSSTTASRPTFTAPAGPSTMTFRLVVNDGQVSSTPSTVTITVTNQPPVAAAGPAPTVPVGATVQLDGAGSSDVNGDR